VREAPGVAQHLWRSRSPLGLTRNISYAESAVCSGARLFLHAQNYFWVTATKNGHPTKIKKDSLLAALYLIEFI
jgi:hypothetical protein